MTAYSDPQLNDNDLELLSAYIDQQLTAAERAALDRRLEREPALQQALDELRTTVALLRDLPPARPPRSFALDPQAVAPKRGWSFPWMQLGSALVAATLLLVFGFVLTRGTGGGATPASAPMAAAAPTAAPAAPAAEAPAASGAAPTMAAAAAAAAATAAPAPTVAPAAALAPAATAAPEAALEAAQQPTEAPPSIASGAPAGAQPFAEATAAAQAPANDAAGAPSTGALRQAAGTPTPATYSAQIATSGSAASDTQALEQQPVPTPQSSSGGGRTTTILLAGALFLIALGGLLVWLFTRRKT